MLKCYAAHLEWKGVQELEMALVGTPAHQLVNPIVKGVCRATEVTPSPSSIPVPMSKKQWASLVWNYLQKTFHPSPTTTMPASLKEKELAPQALSMPIGTCEVITGLPGSPTLPVGLLKRSQVPATSPHWHFHLVPLSIWTWRLLARNTLLESVTRLSPAGTLWCVTAFSNVWRPI